MSRDDPIKEGVKEKKEPEENFLAPKSISQADTQDFHNVCIFIGELPARIAVSGRIRLCDNGRKYILVS